MNKIPNKASIIIPTPFGQQGGFPPPTVASNAFASQAETFKPFKSGRDEKSDTFERFASTDKSGKNTSNKGTQTLLRQIQPFTFG